MTIVTPWILRGKCRRSGSLKVSTATNSVPIKEAVSFSSFSTLPSLFCHSDRLFLSSIQFTRFSLFSTLPSPSFVEFFHLSSPGPLHVLLELVHNIVHERWGFVAPFVNNVFVAVLECISYVSRRSLFPLLFLLPQASLIFCAMCPTCPFPISLKEIFFLSIVLLAQT